MLAPPFGLEPDMMDHLDQQIDQGMHHLLPQVAKGCQ
ncbi:MAG: hypothetical protein GFH27_549291n290 [Chloroflexi bacterium AL-W]|nr:hypothetical protein [Chloroflexi bacterium AL-N1]NOK67242.1 hypothetical protein [Chloroflexi bacterium AL-N10]NOK75264.1 hypothetical protein [Chloroflexi bacterium AL-N5]NOK82052.1 hypothetical protein [Chloroflexi bacterium AL-W]NOK89897.1 hypothetical protein [Chloroflexi bacterium AL-N15]